MYKRQMLDRAKTESYNWVPYAKAQAIGAVQVTRAMLDRAKTESYNWVPYATVTRENYPQFAQMNQK